MKPRARDRYGAAVHEAGHVVVARVFGLKCRRMVAGIGDDDTKGKADIQRAAHLPVVDQIAVCAAGMVAQTMLDAPTHDIAGLGDEVLISNIVEAYEDETEREALRDAGFDKACETLERHRATIERLAMALAEQGELDEVAIERIIARHMDVA